MVILIGLALITGGLATAPRYGLEDTLIVEPDAVPLRAVVLDWSKGLTSFAGFYEILFQYNTPLSTDPDARRIEWANLEYRFQGNDYYCATESNLSYDQRYPVWVYTYLDGVLSRTGYHKIDPSETMVEPSPKDTHELPYPYLLHAILPPPYFFAQDIYYLIIHDSVRGVSLEQFLSNGYSSADHESNLHILRHFGSAYSFEFAIDNAGLVRKMSTYVSAAGSSFQCSEDTRQRLINEYAYDVTLYGRPLTEIQYSDHLFTGGVWFPLSLSVSRFMPNEEGNALAEQFFTLAEESNWTRGEPEFVDAYFEMIAKTGSRNLFEIVETRDFKFKQDDLLVNVPLSKESFVTEKPRGTMVFGKDGFLLYRHTYWTQVRGSLPVILPIVVGVLFLFCGFLWFMYGRKARGRSVRFGRR